MRAADLATVCLAGVGWCIYASILSAMPKDVVSEDHLIRALPGALACCLCMHGVAWVRLCEGACVRAGPGACVSGALPGCCSVCMLMPSCISPNLHHRLTSSTRMACNVVYHKLLGPLS